MLYEITKQKFSLLLLPFKGRKAVTVKMTWVGVKSKCEKFYLGKELSLQFVLKRKHFLQIYKLQI